MKDLIKMLVKNLGYQITPIPSPTAIRDLNPDISESEWATFLAVKPFTMTSLERVLASIQAASYVALNNIPGDVVECGVWRGGSSMAIARTLMEHNDTSRIIYCYDTFEGMTDPGGGDVDAWNRSADGLLEHAKRAEPKSDSLVWAYASIDDVRRNLGTVGYPMKNVVFVRGPVENTIPETLPRQISILRLDTDWYESTKHELEHLYPRLVSSGVLIVDDYGHWSGARKAVDEYFVKIGLPVFLHRIDYTGRMFVKT